MSSHKVHGGSNGPNLQKMFRHLETAAESGSTPSAQLTKEVQHFLKAVGQDASLNAATKSTLSQDVNELLPMMGESTPSSDLSGLMGQIEQLLQAMDTAKRAQQAWKPSDGGWWGENQNPNPTPPPTISSGGGGGGGGAPVGSPSSGGGTLSIPTGGTATPQPGTESLYPSGSPTAADINQRGVGDCALMAPLADLAQSDPAAITNMISSDGKGGYNVTLYPNGQKTTVDVSPGDIQKNGAVGANGQTDWGSVVEAAALKVVPGGFQSGADPAAMMQLLTGKRGTDQGTASLGQSGTESTISSALSQGGLVTATSTNGGTTSNGAQIVGDHDYSVLGVSGGQVTVRNPWGQGQANDGVITMSIADFDRIFDGVQSN